jgi:hypothetical protein
MTGGEGAEGPDAVIERLEADNERLRGRVFELLGLMEEAVTAQVRAERHVAELREQVDNVQVELDALRRSRTFRLTRPVRRLYGRFRGHDVW